MPAYDYEQLVSDFHSLFGRRQYLDTAWLKKLQHAGWVGLISLSMRGVSWRVLLGLLPVDKSLWPQAMEQSYLQYERLKKVHLPDINQVKVDPLSGLFSAEKDRGADWDAYYKKLDVVKFIQGDLERLYMNGIEEEYFQDSRRAKLLLNVLFVWTEEHPHTSGYRQGMHEIAAPILLALESEASLWREALLSASGESLSSSEGLDRAVVQYFSDEEYLEASLYGLFERVMWDIDYLYTPPTQAGELPGVVEFCTQVQEEMLRALDPALCRHLEENYVQAQLYGMRWARLLLGREFEAVEESLFRIWDYIFASSLCIQDRKSEERVADSGVSAVVSTCSDPLFNAPATPDSTAHEEEEEWTTSSAEMRAKRKAQFNKPSPILEALADFMLAMLLHIREDLLSGDNSSTLQLLMRYPPVEDITPIIDLVDMIRRGVLDLNAHVGAGGLGKDGRSVSGTSDGVSGGKSSTPSWLWKESSSSTDHSNDNDSPSFSIRNLKGVSKMVGQKLSSAVSTSMSALQGSDNGCREAGSESTITTSKNSLGNLGSSNLFGRGDGKARSVFEGSTQKTHQIMSNEENSGAAEECSLADQCVAEEDKRIALTNEEVLRLAGCLENWTADSSRQDPAVFMPGVIKCLHDLSDLLSQEISLTEYMDVVEGTKSLMFKEEQDSVELDHLDSQVSTDAGGELKHQSFNATTTTPKDLKGSTEKSGNDFFVNIFGLETTATKNSRDNSSGLLNSLTGDDCDQKCNRDIFSD